MKPGFHPNIPIQQYHADRDSWSSNQLRLLNESPMSLKHKLDDPEPVDLTIWGNTNRPMCIGGATAALMSPVVVLMSPVVTYDAFAEDYVVMDHITSAKNKNTKEFKQKFSQLTTDNPGKTVILQQEYEQAMDIVDAVHSHHNEDVRRQLTDFFDSDDLVVEGSWCHKDEETGLLLKTRPDWCQRRRLAGDLKTVTGSCDEASISKQMLKTGYHIQAAMAIDIINHVDSCLIQNWLLVVVEQSPPHDVSCWYIDAPTLALGHRQYRHAVKLLAECLEKDEWPGKESTIRPLNVPDYALEDYA